MKNLLILLTFFLFLGCTSTEEKANPTLTYRILKSIEIPIKANVQYAHSQIQLVNEHEFIGLDQNFNKLDVFSLKDDRFIKSIHFEQDGPNRIYPVSSFYYHNKDSIFLFSLAASSFQLINDKAKVLSLFRMDENKYPSEISNTIVGTDNRFYPISITKNEDWNLPFVYNSDNGELIVNTLPETYLEGFNDRQSFYSAPITSNFDVSSLEFTTFSGRWPKEIYHQKMAPNNPFTNFCFNATSQEILINFYNADKIYSVKRNKFYKVQSNAAKGDVTLFDIESTKEYTTEEELDALSRDEGYVNLIYDQFEDKYYRIFKHSSHNQEGSIHKMEAEWSLVAFTSDFKVLGEVRFPASIYNFLQIMPTKEGILISKESAFSKHNNEEKYEFDLVKFDF
jgi:hypothetical protein